MDYARGVNDISVWTLVLGSLISSGCGGTTATLRGEAYDLRPRHVAKLAQLGARELACPEDQLELTLLESVSDRDAIYRVEGCGKMLDALYWREQAWVAMPDREAEFALSCTADQLVRSRISENTFGYAGCDSRIIYRLHVGMQLTFVRDTVAPAEPRGSSIPTGTVPGPAQPPP